MLRVIILSVLTVAICAQYQGQQPGGFQTTPSPRNFHPQAPVHYVSIGGQLQGDYKFGYDTGKGPLGQSFREESRLPDGTIKGQYGILDANGQQRIIKYSAGRFGFQAEGDGIHPPPAAPQQAAPQGAPVYQQQPQQQYGAQQFAAPQQYQSPAPQYQQPAPQYQAPAQFSGGLSNAAPTPFYDHQKHYLQYQVPEDQQLQRTPNSQPGYFDTSLLAYDIGNQQKRRAQ